MVVQNEKAVLDWMTEKFLGVWRPHVKSVIDKMKGIYSDEDNIVNFRPDAGFRGYPLNIVMHNRIIPQLLNLGTVIALMLLSLMTSHTSCFSRIKIQCAMDLGRLNSFSTTHPAVSNAFLCSSEDN